MRSLVAGALVGLMAAIPAIALGSTQSADAGTRAPHSSHSSVPAAKDVSDEVSVEVAPASAAVVHPGQDLQLDVTITNGTAESVESGTLDVFLAERALTTRSSLDDWLRPDSGSKAPGEPILSQETTMLQAGETVSVPVTVPAASVPLGAGTVWGPQGITATVTTGDDVSAEARSSFVWYAGEAITPVNLGVVMPITTPAGTSGLIPATALEAFTAPTGVLSRQLDGALNRPVTIAIDPMIIASIRILGDAAPASAVGWLDRLSRASNEIFPLSYGDADISLQAQTGMAALLAPVSFEQAIDGSRFDGPTEPGETSEAPGNGASTSTSPSPTPTPTSNSTPGAGTPPTSAELLDWAYSATDIGWPAAGVVAEADLPVFAASGLNTTILSGNNASRPDNNQTPNAAMAMGAGQGLVTDDALSTAIRAATEATTDAAWHQAIAEASSLLAVVAAEGTGSPRTLLATFDRGWPPTATRVSQTLDALTALPWEAPATLAAVRAAPPAGDVSFQAQAEPADRVDLASRLLQREVDLDGFATALSNPLAVTGTYRLDLLALLATSWKAQPDLWGKQVATSLVASSATLQSVSVTTRGPINVAANKVDFPITLRNQFDQAVTVKVQVVPSNGRLIVGSDIKETIGADSAKRITVPVTAAIGNGDVTLRVSMSTPTDVPIGTPALIAVNVQAEWEGIGAIILAALVVLFFGFGVWRNIVRRRQERADGHTETTDAAPEAAPEAEAVDAGDAATTEPTESDESDEPDEPDKPDESPERAEPTAEPRG